jgi:hypothetical protein
MIPSRIIVPEDQLAEKFRQAINILAKLRYYEKKFEADHTAVTKDRVILWKNNADIYLESLIADPDPDFIKPEANEHR